MPVRWRRSAQGMGILLVFALVVALAPTAGAEPEPTQEDFRRAQMRLAASENDFNLAVDRYEEARAELASLQQETAKTRQRVAQLQVKAAEGRKNVAKAAGQMYRHAGQPNLAMVLSAHGIADVSRRISYLEAIQEAHIRLVERATADERALSASLVQLRESRDSAKATVSELGRMRSELESMVARQRGQVAGIQSALTRAQQASRERAGRARSALGAREERAVPPPRLMPPRRWPARPEPAPGSRSGAQAAVRAALSQLGKPYRWGASGPGSYDCSGLMLWAWARAGVSLPHSSRAQYAATRRVSHGQWQPGDLLFFGSPIHHVGMYIGDGKMVAAPHSGAAVRTSSVSRRRDYVGAGRP
jgi:cell wall-associated NlpC family hydrolase